MGRVLPLSICLAIETSTSRTSVAIIDQGALLWHGYKDGATSHGDAVPALVSEALLVQPLIEEVVELVCRTFVAVLGAAVSVKVTSVFA